MKKRKEFTPAKRKEIRRRIIFYASVFFITALLVGAIYLSLFSDVPKVRAIEVHGNRLVNKEEIINEAEKLLAREKWWRSVLGKDHIFFWQSGEIRDIKEAIPKLKTAEVRLRIQKRIVEIEVKEEEAKGVWCAEEKRCFVFNETGVLFAEAPEVRGYLITKIMGEEGVPIGVGDEVLGNAAWFQNIRKTIEEVEGAGIRVKTARMRDREQKEWSIETAEGTEILFALDQHPENIGLILRELKKENEGGSWVIDFRVPEKVYVR